MVSQSPDSTPPESLNVHSPKPIEKIRKVVIPIYITMDVMSEDSLEAECVAIDALRSLTITSGVVSSVKFHSLISTISPDPS